MKTQRLPEKLNESRLKLRLRVERLEDRLVPGETLSGLLFMPMGLSPVHSFLAQEMATTRESVKVLDSSSSLANESVLSDQDSTDAASRLDWTDHKAAESNTQKTNDSGSTDQVFADNSSSITFTSGRQSSGVFNSNSGPSRMGGTGMQADLAASHFFGGAASMANNSFTPVMDMGQPSGANFTPGDGAAEASSGPGFAEPNVFVRPAGHSATPAAFGGYSPAQIKSAYGVNLLSQTGAGVTIAIVDAFDAPRIATDLAAFSTRFGLPAANFTKVFAQGVKPRFNAGWAQEISLDVEWAHAMAPAANIVLVEARTSSFANLYGAVDNAVNVQHAQVVSMSWSGGESSGETANDSHFNKNGVSFIASSGDVGGAVGYPSTSPYVISAGGTSLPFDSNGNPIPSAETTWSSAGGGPSTVETRPGYQTGFYTGSTRGTPDFSSDSDPNTGVLVVYNGSLFIFGGTSVAAPTLAGELALADQGRATPLSSNNLTSRTEYNAAAGALYASNYRDITTGSNGHAATVGYDLATGLGAPIANNWVPWLNANS